MTSAIDATSPHAMTKVWVWIVGSLALLAGAAACALRIVIDFADGGGMSGWTFLSVLVFYPLLFVGIFPLSYGLFALAAHLRFRAVTALRPNNFVIHIGIAPAARRQFQDAGRALGSPTVSPPKLGFGVLAASNDSLYLYTGGNSPRIGLILPTSSISAASVIAVPTGFGTTPGILLEFADSAGVRWPVTIRPLRWRNVVPGTFQSVDVAALLAEMQRATHPGTVPAA